MIKAPKAMVPSHFLKPKATQNEGCGSQKIQGEKVVAVFLIVVLYGIGGIGSFKIIVQLAACVIWKRGRNKPPNCQRSSTQM